MGKIENGPVEQYKESSEILLPLIEERVAELKKFETDLTNPEVHAGLEVIHSFMDPHLSLLESKGIVATYHGSLQYNDPQRLDVDISFFTHDIPIYRIDTLMFEIGEEIKQSGRWPREKCSLDIHGYELAWMRKDIDIINRIALYESNPLYGASVSMGTSQLLTSALFYESQRPLMTEIQNKARTMILENAWLGQDVLEILDEAIDIRKERRGLL